MAIVRRMHEGGGSLIEPGTYVVTCTEVQPDTLPNPQFGDGNVIKFKFTVDDMFTQDGEPVELSAMANDSLNPFTKLFEWLTALGMNFQIDEDSDIEDVIGRKAQAVVVVPKKDDGSRGFAKVDKLVPLARGAKTEEALDLFWRKIKAKGMGATNEELRGFRMTVKEQYGKEPADMTPAELEAVLDTL